MLNFISNFEFLSVRVHVLTSYFTLLYLFLIGELDHKTFLYFKHLKLCSRSVMCMITFTNENASKTMCHIYVLKEQSCNFSKQPKSFVLNFQP